MVSNTIKMAVFLIVGLLVGGAAVYFLVPSSTSSTNSTTGKQTKIYYIGMVTDLTGPIASFGADYVKAAQLAINQINTDMNLSGNGIQFRFVTADSKGTPEGALAGLQTLYQTYHIQIDIGPLGSTETAGMLSYANTNHILCITPSAGASNLAISNDYLVRPDDVLVKNEGPSYVSLATQLGVKNMIVVYRNDAYGGTFYNSTVAAAPSTLKVVGIPYTPGLSDYANIVQQASSAVASVEGTGKTAVFWITFTTEAINMWTHAATDPTLLSVQWFGGDNDYVPDIFPPGVAANVGQAYLKTNLTVLAAVFTKNPVTLDYLSAFQQAYGRAPTPYAEQNYDSTWIAALTILYSGGVYNGTVFLHNIFPIARTFIGVDGQTYIDANGDQLFNNYGFYRVVTNSTGGLAFQQVGTYSGAANTVTYTG